MKCRHCHTDLNMVFIDLGSAPPSNAYLTPDTLFTPETWYPLQVLVCEKCWLVQTYDCIRAEDLFTAGYAYYSSYSESWLRHAQIYVEEMIERFRLSVKTQVVEIGANDGYLLQYFHREGIPCLGVEPAAGTAQAARDKGIQMVEDFFGMRLSRQLAESGKHADLMVANNVLAHVPDINDFIAGFRWLLKPDGIATFEFPHLLRLIEKNQLDTIYHEHFSYLSLITVMRIFQKNKLTVFDVEELPTHGGSLRIYAQRSDTGFHQITSRVGELLSLEKTFGLDTVSTFIGFQARAEKVKNDFLAFLIELKRAGRNIIGYGAAAKGNTLLNYAGVRPDLLPMVVDRNPAKQGKLLPGSRIPIVDEAQVQKIRPDYVFIIPWNIQKEIMEQLSYIKEWGGKFFLAIPRLTILGEDNR